MSPGAVLESTGPPKSGSGDLCRQSEALGSLGGALGDPGRALGGSGGALLFRKRITYVFKKEELTFSKEITNNLCYQIITGGFEK